MNWLLKIRWIIHVSLLSVLIFSNAGVANGGRNSSLVMIGGGLQEDNLEIWNTLVNLAGGANVRISTQIKN